MYAGRERVTASKGSGTLLLLFEMLAVIFIAVAVLNIGQAYASSDYSWKIETIENLNLMINTLLGVPGDVQVQYPVNISGYTVLLEGNKIALFTAGEAEHLWLTRSFVLPEGYTSQGVVEQSETLCFEKKGTALFLKPCQLHTRREAEHE